jgi:hypothetical protein
MSKMRRPSPTWINPRPSTHDHHAPHKAAQHRARDPRRAHSRRQNHHELFPTWSSITFMPLLFSHCQARVDGHHPNHGPVPCGAPYGNTGRGRISQTMNGDETEDEGYYGCQT